MTVWYRAPSMIGLASLIVTALATSPSHAATLTGDTITGTLNFCTLGNGGNQFTADSGAAPVTFIHDDGIGGANTDTASFDATSLTVQDIVHDDSTACGWGMQFTDTTTPFPLLALVSTSFSPDLSYDLTGGVITINWSGTDTPGTYTAVFNIDGETSGAAVPEPGSLATFGIGIAGMGLLRQRRRLSA
jgi:hypothetical protein